MNLFLHQGYERVNPLRACLPGGNLDHRNHRERRRLAVFLTRVRHPQDCCEFNKLGSGVYDMSKRSVFVAFLHRFAGRKDGGTAVELAMVAIPFFSLVFAIFEVALIYLGTSSLDNGLTAAARQIRTGQAQSSNMTGAQFRQLVCDRITPLLACDSRLVIDVRRFGSFGSIVVPPPLDGTGNFAGGNVFQSGAAGDIIVARAYYAWPLVSPTSYIFSNMTGNQFMLSASTAFRNEPF